MKGPELSPRLWAIADRVPPGAVLADVGTDHAYLPAALLCGGRIRRAVATDVNEGPLARARETARLYGVEDTLETRLCDGLAGIQPGGADTVVVAGMGGELIARILAEAPWTRAGTLLLLQPMTAQPELRKWLQENGYRIRREDLVREGEKLYVILTAEGGAAPPLDPGELWAGRQTRDREQPLRLAYLDDLIRRRRRAAEGMARSAALPPARLAEERALIARLEEMREEWIAWRL